MLDQVQSSAISRRTLAGEIPQPPEAERPLADKLSRPPKTDEPLYSIRITERPDAVCTACRKHKTGEGPVGYMDDSPVCDLCLLERSTDLGVLIAISAVSRTYAENAAELEALNELGAFARIYHRIASKSWANRIFRIPPPVVIRPGEIREAFPALERLYGALA